MADFTIDASQLRRLEKSLAKAGVDFKKGAKRFLSLVGDDIMKEAKRNCPESPDKAEYESTLVGGKTKRSPTSFTTGDLRDSITVEAKSDKVSIFVPSNSKGASYAEKVHSKRGIKEWGVRTKKKGERAKEEFIYRGYDQAKKDIDSAIDDAIASLVRDIGV